MTPDEMLDWIEDNLLHIRGNKSIGMYVDWLKGFKTITTKGKDLRECIEKASEVKDEH